MINLALAELLKKKRTDKNLTHRQVASHIARTRTGYLTLEKGGGRLHLDEAIILMRLLGITWEEYEACLGGATKLEKPKREKK